MFPNKGCPCVQLPPIIPILRRWRRTAEPKKGSRTSSEPQHPPNIMMPRMIRRRRRRRRHTANLGNPLPPPTFQMQQGHAAISTPFLPSRLFSYYSHQSCSKNPGRDLMLVCCSTCSRLNVPQATDARNQLPLPSSHIRRLGLPPIVLGCNGEGCGLRSTSICSFSSSFLPLFLTSLLHERLLAFFGDEI